MGCNEYKGLTLNQFIKHSHRDGSSFLRVCTTSKLIQKDKGVGLCRVHSLSDVFHMTAEGRKALIE